MKKYILIILVSFFIVSCSKEDCSKQLEKVTSDYIAALNNTNGSSTAVMELTLQYEAKKQQILKNCE